VASIEVHVADGRFSDRPLVPYLQTNECGAAIMHRSKKQSNRGSGRATTILRIDGVRWSLPLTPATGQSLVDLPAYPAERR
jgi:hypothetical protein